MLRSSVSALVALFLCLGVLMAADNKKDTKTKNGKKTWRAKITKVDRKNGTFTVRLKNKEGKTITKTFKLTEEVRMLDSTGKAVAIDVFRSGDYILVVEAEGKLKEVRKSKIQSGTKEKPAKEKK